MPGSIMASRPPGRSTLVASAKKMDGRPRVMQYVEHRYSSDGRSAKGVRVRHNTHVSG